LHGPFSQLLSGDAHFDVVDSFVLRRLCSAMTAKSKTLTVMLVDDQPARAALLEQALLDHDYKVIARLSSADGLAEQVARLEPDVIIIDIESPDRDTLEHMASLHRDNPRPVVMFAEEGDTSAIERAMRAGVSAYVVDGLNPARVKTIVDVAIARFREFQALRRELEETRTQLADRKQIDRAKGLLMKQRGLDEQQAYNAMRKMAMDRGQRLAEVASNIIAVFDLLDS
jgi:response regulator NasT